VIRSGSHSTATLFAALGDPCRLSIVERLCEDGPLPTTLLNHGDKGLSRQGFAKHLRVLENAGLVASIRVGRDRFWQVRSEQVAELRAYLEDVALDWEARMERLKSLVEDSGATPDENK
jgi:DNA-binding transcriptional ArsR family regulator